jgi:hypothetical protein
MERDDNDWVDLPNAMEDSDWDEDPFWQRLMTLVERTR